MDNKKIILIAIVVLVVILAIFGAYLATKDNNIGNIAENKTNHTVINVDLANNTTKAVGDNSTRANENTTNNTTYKVYNPQSDSYVPVIGEKFDDEVNRWYTYDADGVRYYNTRIN